MPNLQIEYTLVWIQLDNIMHTMNQNHANMLWIILTLPRINWKIVQVCLYYMIYFLESIGHHPLECGTNIFSAKW